MLLNYQIVAKAIIVVRLGILNVFVRILFFKGGGVVHILQNISSLIFYILARIKQTILKGGNDMYTFILVSIEMKEVKQNAESEY